MIMNAMNMLHFTGLGRIVRGPQSRSRISNAHPKHNIELHRVSSYRGKQPVRPVRVATVAVDHARRIISFTVFAGGRNGDSDGSRSSTAAASSDYAAS